MNDIEDISRKCILTEGVAGAGKTTAAIDNVNQYLSDHPEKKDKVILLTLTNTGAKEIGIRTNHRINGNTMHSFCWALIKTQYAMKNRNIPKIVDETVSKKYMLDSIRTYCPNDDPEMVCRCISDIRLFGRSEAEYSKEIREAYHHYLTRLQTNNELDFTRILEKAYVELQRPEVYRRYDGAYIICDEVQDFNPFLEWKIIDILRRRSDCFMLYASPSQEIYPFRGANYSLIRQMLPENTEKTILNESYRCVPEVVEVARHLGGEDASKMVSRLDSTGVSAKWYESANNSLSIRMLINSFDDISMREELKPKDFAILARSSAQLSSTARKLEMYGIRTTRVGSDPDIYKSEPVRRFTDYLSIAFADDESCLDNVFCYPCNDVDEEDLIALRGAKRLTWKHLREAAENPDKYAQAIVKRSIAILKFRDISKTILESSRSDEEKICLLQDASGICNLLNEQLMFSDSRKIDRICSEINLHRSLKKYWEYLVERISKDEIPEEGINLCTYHSSKGREWQTVFLLENENSTICKTAQDMTVSRNVAYVACTRAKRNLLISTETQTGYPTYFDFMKDRRRTWYQ